LNEAPPPSAPAVFDARELTRLNQELKLLRDSIKRKKSARDQAKKEGRSVPVDLRPEIQRLTHFLVDLDVITNKLTTAQSSQSQGASGTEALTKILLQMKSQLETERTNLRTESEDKIKRPERAPDDPRFSVETLQKEKAALDEKLKSIESVVQTVKSEHEQLKASLTKLESEERRLRGQAIPTTKPTNFDNTNGPELPDLSDDLSEMKTEVQKIRQDLAREHQLLERKWRDLDEEYSHLEEHRRNLEARNLEARDDENKELVTKIRNEIQADRLEIEGLKKSLQDLRTANLRERRRLEADRESIIRTQVKLAREKQRLAVEEKIFQLRQKHARKLEAEKREQWKGDLKKQHLEPKRLPEQNAKVKQVQGEDHVEGGVALLEVRLGDQNYGINISRVKEIIRGREVTPIPHQPAYLEGVMNVRGIIIPVVNLRKRFDLPGGDSNHSHTVIVESENGLVGMLVDDVSDVLQVPSDHVHAPPDVTKGVGSEFLRGICRLGNRLILYLDIDKTLKRATPIDRSIPALSPGSGSSQSRTQLTEDERRILGAIPRNGGTKTSLKKKVRFGNDRLERSLTSLERKRLIRVHKAGSTKIIRRSET
jgi:purine-binding chemotaxis protein CheW